MPEGENSDFSGSSKSKKLWKVLGAILLLILLAFFVAVQIKNRAKINQGLMNVPKSFVLTEKNLKPYQISGSEEAKLYKLNKGESLRQQGVRYEINKPQREAVGEVVSKMIAEKWAGIGGTLQDQEKTVLKMGRDREVIFMSFTGGLEENQPTTVTIFAVEVSQ